MNIRFGEYDILAFLITFLYTRASNTCLFSLLSVLIIELFRLSLCGRDRKIRFGEYDILAFLITILNTLASNTCLDSLPNVLIIELFLAVIM